MKDKNFRGQSFKNYEKDKISLQKEWIKMGETVFEMRIFKNGKEYAFQCTDLDKIVEKANAIKRLKK